ncbi:MAG: holo-ACP synthase [Planctomycetes bacterium]|nr:holo-ACP synthase [Planctomycetota bacterium]
MIIGTGIDVCEISRMEGLLSRRGPQAQDRLFTSEEVRYCSAKARPSQSFAARFAAKEAVMKMLGTGWSNGVRWRDIEVRRGKGGPPAIQLYGVAAKRAETMGIQRIHLSITHSGDLAIVHVIGETA